MVNASFDSGQQMYETISQTRKNSRPSDTNSLTLREWKFFFYEKYVFHAEILENHSKT